MLTPMRTLLTFAVLAAGAARLTWRTVTGEAPIPVETVCLGDE